MTLQEKLANTEKQLKETQKELKLVYLENLENRIYEIDTILDKAMDGENIMGYGEELDEFVGDCFDIIRKMKAMER